MYETILKKTFKGHEEDVQKGCQGKKKHCKDNTPPKLVQLQ